MGASLEIWCIDSGASFLIVLRQLAVGTVLTCLFCFIVYLPLRRLSGKSRKRSR